MRLQARIRRQHQHSGRACRRAVEPVRRSPAALHPSVRSPGRRRHNPSSPTHSRTHFGIHPPAPGPDGVRRREIVVRPPRPDHRDCDRSTPGFLRAVDAGVRNLGEAPLRLYPGQTIAQLFFHELNSSKEEVLWDGLQRQDRDLFGLERACSKPHLEQTHVRQARAFRERRVAAENDLRGVGHLKDAP